MAKLKVSKQTKVSPEALKKIKTFLDKGKLSTLRFLNKR
jgi:hypothetical protein